MMESRLYRWDVRDVPAGNLLEGIHPAHVKRNGPTWQVEVCLERVRRRECPEKVGRSGAVFAWAAPLAITRQLVWGTAGQRFYLYEVQVLPDAERHVGDVHFCDAIATIMQRRARLTSTDVTAADDLARRYWTEAPAEGCNKVEVFTQEPMRVVARVDELVLEAPGRY